MTFPAWLTASPDHDDPAESRPRLSRDTEDHLARAAVLPLADQRIVERVQAGDSAAMQELVHEYFEALARYANAMLRSQDDAEDVAQDVLAQLWERRATWSPATGIRTYLLGAVRNRVVDVLRRTRAEERRAIVADAAPTRMEAADVSLMSAEEHRLLQRALDELPARWREVVALRYEQQLSFREVGRLIGISEDAAKKLARRAIAELRRVLGL